MPRLKMTGSWAAAVVCARFLPPAGGLLGRALQAARCCGSCSRSVEAGGRVLLRDVWATHYYCLKLVAPRDSATLASRFKEKSADQTAKVGGPRSTTPTKGGTSCCAQQEQQTEREKVSHPAHLRALHSIHPTSAARFKKRRAHYRKETCAATWHTTPKPTFLVCELALGARGNGEPLLSQSRANAIAKLCGMFTTKTHIRTSERLCSSPQIDSTEQNSALLNCSICSLNIPM